MTFFIILLTCCDILMRHISTKKYFFRNFWGFFDLFILSSLITLFGFSFFKRNIYFKSYYFELFLILMRYFFFVLRFFVFFQKSQDTLNNIQNGTTIRIPDYNHFEKGTTEVYENINDNDEDSDISNTDPNPVNPPLLAK